MIIIEFQGKIYTGVASIEDAQKLLTALGFYESCGAPFHAWYQQDLRGVVCGNMAMASIKETQELHHLANHVNLARDEAAEERKMKHPIPQSLRRIPHSY